MRTRIRTTLPTDSGFTLIELLVVTLIIGVLAAIVIPMFLPFQSKAQDAGAKSNARNAVTYVESCETADQQHSYQNCTTQTALEAKELKIVNSTPSSDEVEVSAANATTFEVVGASPNGNLYTIAKQADGSLVRTCSLVAGQTTSGCESNGSW